MAGVSAEGSGMAPNRMHPAKQLGVAVSRVRLPRPEWTPCLEGRACCRPSITSDLVNRVLPAGESWERDDCNIKEGSGNLLLRLIWV